MDFNNHKLLARQNVNNVDPGKDRISELPDSLLHYILSFIGTKFVATTCILSKRWNGIWRSIPNLDFTFFECPEIPSSSNINKFMDFVDTTLHRRDIATNIQNFSLCLFSISNLDASRVHSWIKTFTTHNVGELTLMLYLDGCAPISLVTCESLIKLDLNVGRSIHYPKNISFPKLKSLTLFEVQFTDDCWNENLFSSSLVLEELILKNCTWLNMRKFCILTPALKVLNIDNSKWKADGLPDCDLKIHAPSLVSLTYWGSVAKDYDISRFLTLDKAEVGFFEQRINHGAAVSKFLQSLSDVRCLSVRNAQVLSVSNLPTFHNLNELNLLQGLATDKLIFALLKAAQNIKRLQFDQCCLSSTDDEKEYVETEDMFRHLHSVGFLRFSGEARELRWAELILKNAKSLETMTIAYGARYSDANNKEILMSELSSLPRASGRCVFKFESMWSKFLGLSH